MEGGMGKGVPTTNYIVPLDKSTGMTRPLVEILRDLNKRVPNKIIDLDTNTILWYKESITKSTQGWKERLFSRNSSVADLGSEVKREVNVGIASIARIMGRLENRGSSRTTDSPTTSSSEVCPATEPSNERVTESNSSNTASTSNTSAPCVATAGSN